MLRSTARVFSITLALSAAPLAMSGAQGATSAATNAQATFLDYHTSVPGGWTARTPSSSMRLAEYTTPTTDAGMAEVVVYYFGKGQGGSVDANLERWKSQFTNPAGGPVAEKITHPVGAIPMTVAEYRGTYARGVGAGSDASAARPNHMLIAVVAETPRGTLFFQCFGPIAAVEAQRAAYLQFAQGLK